jgi:hypothetical protein
MLLNATSTTTENTSHPPVSDTHHWFPSWYRRIQSTFKSYFFKIHFNITLPNWLFISLHASTYSERTGSLRHFPAWKQTLGCCTDHHQAPARPVALRHLGHADSLRHHEAEAKHSAVHPKQLPVLLYCTIPGWEHKQSVYSSEMGIYTVMANLQVYWVSTTCCTQPLR